MIELQFWTSFGYTWYYCLEIVRNGGIAKMYNTIAEVIEEWNQEGASTQKVLDALTDESLLQTVSSDDRTLGRIAWHIVTSIPEILSQLGLPFESLKASKEVPSSAREIAEGFREINADAIEAVKTQWTDQSLKEIRNIFGMDLPNAVTLSMVIKHAIHHRGQMTVLMRQAGLVVPGVYGPAREEWAQMGMDAPK
jgi:uncharacterized damage-inducible protein DinB